MDSPRRTLARRALVLPAAALLLAGLVTSCGGEDESPPESSSASPAPSPSPSESPSKSKSTPAPAGTEVDVTVQGDQVTPVAKSVEIGVGDTVTLHITSDRAGELHVHSDPEQELEFGAGKTEVEITIDKPGSVDVEEHESESLILRILVS